MENIFTKTEIHGSPIILMDGHPITTDRVIDFLNEYDVIMRRWAEMFVGLIKNHNFPDGIWCPVCNQWFGGDDDIVHESCCPVVEAQVYLKTLEA